ncbi:MAG: flippase-like domain-containing protein [Bryobacteraceae bacterium]|nr:flippase-like domain-containing protein [Bryobacteraceae bacterium]
MKRFFSYALAVAALMWVFHDVDWRVISAQVGQMQLWWLVPAVLCDVLSYVCEGQRWSLLLRSVAPLPLWRAVQAIYAGLFTNEILPLRAGEVVRAYLGSRWSGAAIPELLPSMAVGRLLDGVWMGVGCALLVHFVALPANLAWAGEAIGLLMLLLVAVFVGLAWRPPRWVAAWRMQPDSAVRQMVGRVLGGIGEIGLNRHWPAAAVYSLGLSVLQAGAFWFVMESAGLGLSFAAGAAVFLIVKLGTAVPNAPANVGSFQFFTVLGLQLFGVEKSAAAAFSVVVFLVLTLPLWALGYVAIANCGVHWAELRGTQ